MQSAKTQLKQSNQPLLNIATLTIPASESTCLETPVSTGYTTLRTLIPDIKAVVDFCIPSEWPKPLNRRGPCCGFLALESVLEYGHPERKNIPPARKDKHHYDSSTTHPHSLREIAKQHDLSQFGEIFDANIFTQISNQVDCNNGIDNQLYDDEKTYWE
jgi:hypothetical protein